MKKNKLTSILDFNKMPFVFLEGGRGLNDDEDYLSKGLFRRGYDIHILDNLYEQERKLGALQFLYTKTIIMGTTGVYRDKLEYLLSIFFTLDLDCLENIILTLRTEEVLWQDMKKLKKKYPKIKFWELDSVLWDSEWTECNLLEIKVK